MHRSIGSQTHYYQNTTSGIKELQFLKIYIARIVPKTHFSKTTTFQGIKKRCFTNNETLNGHS